MLELARISKIAQAWQDFHVNKLVYAVPFADSKRAQTSEAYADVLDDLNIFLGVHAGHTFCTFCHDYRKGSVVTVVSTYTEEGKGAAGRGGCEACCKRAS